MRSPGPSSDARLMPSDPAFPPAGGAPGGARAARDRLMGMLLVATLLHGLLILGVGFGPSRDAGGSTRGLEVLLVSQERPEAPSNPTATYLSQRTQHGSGNTTEHTAARVPGPILAGGRAPAAAQSRKANEAATEEAVATAAPRARVSVAPPVTEETRAAAQAALPLLLGNADSARTQQRVEPDDSLALRGRKRDEPDVAADTRADELAPYLDSWRRRVERIGTLNYPSAAARRGLRGNPVIEVRLARDGQLQNAAIRRSSGHPELDAAALEILKLASPFEPLPAPLADRYPVLDFAYEWQFVGGRLASGSVAIP
jgi:periplasmic protein TonB